MARSIWLFCVLFSFAVYLVTDTSGYVQFDRDLGKSSSSDDDLLKDSSSAIEGCKSMDGMPVNDDCKSKASSEKPKIIRVPLTRVPLRRARRSIDSSISTMNENEGNVQESKAVKNAVASTVNPTEVSSLLDTQQKSTKKGYKKLKLAQSKPGHKKSRNKGRLSDRYLGEDKDSTRTRRYIRDFDGKKQIEYNNTRIDLKELQEMYYPMFKIQRNREHDYYVQRKAVMDKFFAQKHEIEKKYQEQLSTTTENAHGNNLDSRSLGSTVPLVVVERSLPPNLTTAKPAEKYRKRRIEDDDNLNPIDEYEYYYDEDETTTELSSTTPKPATPKPTTPKPTTVDFSDSTTLAPRDNIVYQQGSQCRSPAITFTYQHSLTIDAYAGTEVEGFVLIPSRSDFCIKCIQVQKLSNNAHQVSIVIENGFVKITAIARTTGELSFVVRFYATQKPC